MKVRASVKKMCKDCKVIKRKGVLELFVRTNPKHKQRQTLKRRSRKAMARILGVDIPRNKVMRIALQSIYGVGPKVAEVLEKTNIDLNKNSNELN